MDPLSFVPSKHGETVVVKLDSNKVEQAKKAAERDGVDNIFFSCGKDQYVASGRGLAGRVPGPNHQFPFKSQAGVVASVNDQLDTAWDGVKAVGKVTASVVGAVGALSWALGTQHGYWTAIALNYASAIGFKYVLPGAALTGLAGMGVAAAAGHLRQVDLQSMKRFGEEIPDKGPSIFTAR